MSKLSKVLFKPSGKWVRVIPGRNLLELISRLDLNLSLNCGGKGKCGKCKIIIEAEGQKLGSPSEIELRNLSPEELGQGYRLACVTSVPDIPLLKVKIPTATEVIQQKLQVKAIDIPIHPDPGVKKYLIESFRTDRDNRAYESELVDILERSYGLNCTVDYEGVKELPFAIERGKGLFTCVVWNGNLVVGVEPGDTTEQCLGFAVDIGTTKLAGYLINLKNGKELASSSLTNPQTIYGDDVMSRIAFSMNHKNGLSILQKVVVRGINQLIKDCCEKVKTNSKWIYEVSVSGNTCMTHLFLGISPQSLAFFPYHPVLVRGASLMQRQISARFPILPNARIYVLPSIAGFVGADNVAVQMVVRKLKSKKTRIILDIGTNTEVVLTDERGSLACSCASGPAFEGMHITYGRKADSASIDKVWIDPETLEPTFETIGEVKPAGICGSGIIDAIAEMLKTDIIKPNGKINDQLIAKTSRIRRRPSGELEFVIAWKQETNIENDITITQGDVNEVQKAKAAIYTGCRLLMERKGIKEEDIDEIILAGAFGEYINKQSAQRIGLIPKVPLGKIMEIGNAAGAGAKLALVSLQERETAERIANETGYYELATDAHFAEVFANSMLFPKH